MDRRRAVAGLHPARSGCRSRGKLADERERDLARDCGQSREQHREDHRVQPDRARLGRRCRGPGLKRDFKEAVGVLAIGTIAVLLASPVGLSVLQNTVALLFGSG
jgi:hypothetical protein